jgi:putative transposase
MSTRMRTGHPIPPLTISSDGQDPMECWTRRASPAQAPEQQARVILGCAAGKNNTWVAHDLRLTRQTVGKRRTRFLTKSRCFVRPGGRQLYSSR